MNIFDKKIIYRLYLIVLQKSKLMLQHNKYIYKPVFIRIYGTLSFKLQYFQDRFPNYEHFLCLINTASTRKARVTSILLKQKIMSSFANNLLCTDWCVRNSILAKAKRYLLMYISMIYNIFTFTYSVPWNVDEFKHKILIVNSYNHTYD